MATATGARRFAQLPDSTRNIRLARDPAATYLVRPLFSNQDFKFVHLAFLGETLLCSFMSIPFTQVISPRLSSGLGPSPPNASMPYVVPQAKRQTRPSGGWSTSRAVGA